MEDKFKLTIDNFYVIKSFMDVVEYQDENGGHPFSKWFGKLKTPAALKVRTTVARMESGNFGDVKPVGGGVSETRLNFGPGYRVYFGRDGDTLVILLGGSSKKDQNQSIAVAREHWKNYKLRKKKGGK